MKRFAASVTDFADKFRTDPIRKTEIQIVLLQALFSVLIFALVIVALSVLYQSTLTSIVAKMQEDIASSAVPGYSSVVVAGAFSDVQTKDLATIGIVGFLLAFLFGYVMLRVALSPAKDTLAAQKRFISNVAHELRTPLSIIKTNIEVRLFDADVPKTARTLYHSTLEELDRISHIINNLLTLNTLVSPEHLRLDDVSFGAVVRAVLQKLERPIAVKGITLKADIDARTTVRGNTSALEQIAVNVLKNAIVYSPSGSTIRVSVKGASDRTVCLNVTDAGIGIAQKDLVHIFDPFYRADQARTRSKGGSGLGLAIVSELVRLHRGRILVRSTLKEGTSVSISIPEGRRLLKKPYTTSPSEVGIDYS